MIFKVYTLMQPYSLKKSKFWKYIQIVFLSYFIIFKFCFLSRIRSFCWFLHYLYLFICLFFKIYYFVSISVDLSICWSVYRFSCLSIDLYICLAVYLFSCLYIDLSICWSVYLLICLSVDQYICRSVYLLICLSV